jgi:hypothetical protein
VAANSDVAANLDGDGNPKVDANPEGDDNNEDDTNADDDWGEYDEIEYVGVDDEKEKYKDVLNDDGDDDCDYYPNTNLEDDDPLVMDDERGYEGVVHVTNIDNSKIAIGVTFEDGFCFKRCIRQYPIDRQPMIGTRMRCSKHAQRKQHGCWKITSRRRQL